MPWPMVLLTLLVGTSCGLLASALLFDWVIPEAILRSLIPVLVLGVPETATIVGLGASATLALLCALFAAYRMGASSVVGMLAVAIALGVLGANFVFLWSRVSWSAAVQFAGAEPFGQLGGVLAGTLVVLGASVIVLVVVPLLMVADGRSQWGMGLFAGSVVVAGLVGVAGFAIIESSRQPSPYSYGTGLSYQSSPTGGSYSSPPSTYRSATTSTLPSRVAQFSSRVSCGSLGTGAVAVDYFESRTYRITVCETTGGLRAVNLVKTGGGSRSLSPVSQVNGEYSVSDGGLRLVFDSSSIREYDGAGTMRTVEAVTSASESRRSGDDGIMARLTSLMTTSNEGRTMVLDLARGLNSSCSIGASQAKQMISEITANRRELLAASEVLVRDAGTTSIPVTQFRRSMQHSYDADVAWIGWIDRQWAPYAARGCTGAIQREGDPDWDEFARQSDLATPVKQGFVDAYNSLAPRYGLKSDWVELDI